MSQTQIERLFIKDRTSLQAQQWRLTSEVSSGSAQNAAFSDNISIMSGDGYGSVGSNLTFTSGVFSFPSTGIYLLIPQGYGQFNTSASTYAGVYINTTTDNSTYSFAVGAYQSPDSSGQHFSTSAHFIFDVTDTSTHKFQLGYQSHGGATFTGSTGGFFCGVTVIRLGDT